MSIVLMTIPGPPVMDDATKKRAEELMSKGYAGTISLSTDDAYGSYEQLEGRGVVFADSPNKQPYGIDSSFRDPSGNHIRLTQVTDPAFT